MTRRKPRPVRTHMPTPDHAAPGCCTCGLRLDVPNARHTDRPTPAAEAHQAVEHARLADRD